MLEWTSYHKQQKVETKLWHVPMPHVQWNQSMAQGTRAPATHLCWEEKTQAQTAGVEEGFREPPEIWAQKCWIAHNNYRIYRTKHLAGVVSHYLSIWYIPTAPFPNLPFSRNTSLKLCHFLWKEKDGKRTTVPSPVRPSEKCQPSRSKLLSYSASAHTRTLPLASNKKPLLLLGRLLADGIRRWDPGIKNGVQKSIDMLK